MIRVEKRTREMLSPGRALTVAKSKRSKVTRRDDRHKMMWPLVVKAEPSLQLTEAQFNALEKAGRISLTTQVRRSLNAIAESWISHDRELHSPRPAQFRSRLASIRNALEKASAEADWLRSDATTFERHLFHWLWNSKLPGVDDALSHLAVLPQTIQFFRTAEESLPADKGSTRPRDDYRFIQYLADQFEVCGGRARAYRSSHNKDGYANTAFRQFVHQFYGCLHLKSPHRGSGLDEAIRKALMQRRGRADG
jgi:hypothetical protein